LSKPTSVCLGRLLGHIDIDELGRQYEIDVQTYHFSLGECGGKMGNGNRQRV